MEESYQCRNCGTLGSSRDITGDGEFVCPQCGHRSARSGGGSKLPIFISVVVVGIIAAVGAVFASGAFSGDSLPVAAVSSPIDTDIETTKTSEIPTATLTFSLTEVPTPVSGVEVGNYLAQLLRGSSPKSCPDCNLAKANLTLANLVDANLTGANLSDAELYETDLSGADLTGANLRRANLTDADLTWADLNGVDLTGANLRSANLRYANLTGANLTDADLTEANLFSAELYETDLYGAGLTGANLHRANLFGANLFDATLSKANLTLADLTDANLRRANLTGAKLERATLTGASLNEANLTEAKLAGAKLTNAILDGVIGGDFTGALNVPAKYPKTKAISPTKLLAKFEFNDSPENSVPSGPPMVLENTSYENQVLRLDGRYYHGDPEGYLAIIRNLSGLKFELFSISTDFLVEADTELKNFLDYHPIVVGGTGYRWFSIYLNSNDELGISLNNNDYLIPSSVKIDRDSWYNVTGTFDLHKKKVELYLGVEKIIDHTLPSDFILRVISDGSYDTNVTLTNYSNGTAFEGLIDNLSIWNGITPGNPNP